MFYLFVISINLYISIDVKYLLIKENNGMELIGSIPRITRYVRTKKKTILRYALVVFKEPQTLLRVRIGKKFILDVIYSKYISWDLFFGR